MFLLRCVFCLILLIVVKHIYFGNSKKASRKDSEERSRTEEIENGEGIRLRLINFYICFCPFLFFYLNKIKLTMALHCECKMSLKALVVSIKGFYNHVHMCGYIYR